MSDVKERGAKASAVKRFLSTISTEQKNAALSAIKKALFDNRATIISANAVDLENGRENGLSSGLLDRLMLNNERISGLEQVLRHRAAHDAEADESNFHCGFLPVDLARECLNSVSIRFERVTPAKAGVQSAIALRYWIPYMDSSRFAKVS